MGSNRNRKIPWRSLAFWIVLGIAMGTAFGVSVNNVAPGVVIGLATGLFIGFLQYRYRD